MTDLHSFDREVREKHRCEILCGTDEAGRGPLAGPVTAAAVILDENDEIEGLNDSKKLTEKKREALFAEITARAKSWAVVHIENDVIDEINILQASLLAMSQAIGQLEIIPDLVLVDGTFLPNTPHRALPVVKGDQQSACIAAASILAKVSRDRLMKQLGEQYPEFEFERHKGYPTKLHYQKISQFGATKIHRKSFLKKISYQVYDEE